MDLKDDEQTELEGIFELCEENESQLNSWERDFVADNQARYNSDMGGDNGYFCSSKMWKIFRKIRDKLEGDNR